VKMKNFSVERSLCKAVDEEEVETMRKRKPSSWYHLRWKRN